MLSFVFFETQKFNDLAAKPFAGGEIDEKIESVIEIAETSEREDQIAVHVHQVETEQQEEERVGYVTNEIGEGQGEQRAGRLDELIATLQVLSVDRRVSAAAV